MEKEKLDKLINELDEELEYLNTKRAQNSEEYSLMSDEELVDQLTSDYEEVCKDAFSLGVPIELIVDEDDEDE